MRLGRKLGYSRSALPSSGLCRTRSPSSRSVLARGIAFIADELHPCISQALVL